MRNFRKTIISIVEQHDESIDSNFHLDIDAEDDAVMDLSIERHDNELIVCQYYHQHGDLIRDPEVRFRIKDDKWQPISYRIDALNAYEYSTERLDIDDTLEMWAQNLQSQGFLDK